MEERKYLYGKLNKETAKATYKAVNSDSVKLTVDNDAMTLKADVIWDAILGHTYHKAYPGSEGVRNYQKILELTELLNNEIATATSTRKDVETRVSIVENETNEVLSEVKDRLNNEIKRSTEVDNELLSKILVETARAIKAEDDLLALLQSEVKTRSDIDSQLKERLDLISGASSDGVSSLVTRFEDEVKRSKAVEKELKAAIEEEKTRALTKEASLQAQVSNNTTNITAVESDLSNAIEEETAARKVAISNLSNELNSKVTSLDNAVKNSTEQVKDLSDQVSKNKFDIAALKISSDKVVEDVKELHTHLETNSESISSLSTILDNTNKTVSSLNDDLNAEIRRAKNEEDHLQDQLNELTKGTYEDRIVLNDLANRSAKVEKVVDSLTSVSGDAVDTLNEINAKLDEHQQEYLTLAQFVDTEIERAKEEDEEHDIRLDALQRSINSHSTDIQIINQGLVDLDSKIDNTNQDLFETNYKLAEEKLLRDTQWYAVNKELELEIKRSKEIDIHQENDIRNNSDRITALQKDIANMLQAKFDELKPDDFDFDQWVGKESAEREERDAQLEQMIKDEASVSEQRFDELTQQLEAASATSAQKDSDLEKRIEDESNASKQRDKALQDQIDNLEFDFENNQKFEDFINNTLQDTLQSVKDEIDRKLEDVNVTYDFIDGGRAPLE